MTIKEMEQRVLELMKKNRMNTNDEILFIDIVTIYAQAQQDLLKKQLKELKEK
ncbi:MAG: hypothetical protein BWY55_00955 [archaeon ADurb.Bin336]|jgi:replication-associated recombination protein RarA|nr:MAG: hypothetical protein BWY55_00955 [archaeon ADurb.Bin336]